MGKYKNIEVVEISEGIHRLSGVSTVEYVFSVEQKEVVININNVEVCVYRGREAIEIISRITDDDWEKQFTRTCLMRNDCYHVNQLRGLLKRNKEELKV